MRSAPSNSSSTLENNHCRATQAQQVHAPHHARLWFLLLFDPTQHTLSAQQPTPLGTPCEGVSGSGVGTEHRCTGCMMTSRPLRLMCHSCLMLALQHSPNTKVSHTLCADAPLCNTNKHHPTMSGRPWAPSSHTCTAHSHAYINSPPVSSHQLCQSAPQPTAHHRRRPRPVPSSRVKECT